MGRRYATELDQLRATYEWAASTDIEGLVAGVSTMATLPLLAVGSGGSLSAAHHASGLHQESTGLVSKAVTPLEIVRSSIYLGAHGVMFLSAGGTNADIIGSFRNVIEREPRRCTVLCLRRGSALSKVTAKYGFVRLVELTPPIPKDGFLSTNSLLAFAVLLERAYARVFGTGEGLPATFGELLPITSPVERLIARFRAECRPLWKRDTILVLHGTSVHAAAVDLESKFSEAALGHVQLADFRNFAHGRHNWVAKHGDTTGVLAVFSDADQELAEETLELLPAGVQVARLRIPAAGASSRVVALIAVLHVVGEAGEARGIDPGRPRIPLFGRKIYHLQAFSNSRRRLLSPEMRPIARKAAMDPSRLTEGTVLKAWRKAFGDFVAKLVNASFGSILFDYDGTLCERSERFTRPGDEITLALKRILAAKIPVGIATGRGKSVKEALRKVISKAKWDLVLVGYYNCTEMARLSDDACPNACGAPVGSLGEFANKLSLHPMVAKSATIEVRPTQASVLAKSAASTEIVWRATLDLVQSYRDLKVVRSSHSIDILSQDASKTALLKALREMVAPQHVLCIGDMGRWPGNDHDILASQYSLSVDEVSATTDSCWNLAPIGLRGVQATVHYLGAVKSARGTFTLDIDKLAPLGKARECP